MQWLAWGEPDVPETRDWLSTFEAERLSTIRYTKRFVEFLLRRYTGKRAVSAALGMATDAETLSRIEILNRPTGAPFVQIDGAQAPLDISLTDRAGWAISLIGGIGSMAAGTLGVDLELLEPRTRGFVTDFLTPAEQEWVFSNPDLGSEYAAANLMWSAKEAALKVMRVGLRADTRTVEVTPAIPARPDGWHELSVRHVSGQVFPGWWRCDGVFLLTITGLEVTEPPTVLPGGGDIASAQPIHSWLANPRLKPE